MGTDSSTYEDKYVSLTNLRKVLDSEFSFHHSSCFGAADYTEASGLMTTQQGGTCSIVREIMSEVSLRAVTEIPKMMRVTLEITEDEAKELMKRYKVIDG